MVQHRFSLVLSNVQARSCDLQNRWVPLARDGRSHVSHVAMHMSLGPFGSIRVQLGSVSNEPGLETKAKRQRFGFTYGKRKVRAGSFLWWNTRGDLGCEHQRSMARWMHPMHCIAE